MQVSVSLETTVSTASPICPRDSIFIKRATAGRQASPLRSRKKTRKAIRYLAYSCTTAPPFLRAAILELQSCGAQTAESCIRRFALEVSVLVSRTCWSVTMAHTTCRKERGPRNSRMPSAQPVQGRQLPYRSRCYKLQRQFECVLVEGQKDWCVK